MNFGAQGRALVVCMALAASHHALATPASAVFFVDQPNSSLKITVKARGFSDDDMQQLTGTIDATFDFGTTGAFPATANVTVTGSRITPVADYNFRLGFPPFLGITANARGLVADATTPAPPATMTKTGNPAAYQFDASQFNIALTEGVITVSGFVDDMVDLSQEDPPLGGSSAPGTLGTVVFTTGAVSGPYTLLSAALTLPINIERTVMFGDPPDEEPVDLTLLGTVKASASFYAALAGVPGDFDNDADVDAADLPLWRAGFGKLTGATRGDGDANGDGAVDGADFLVWQAIHGLAPPLPGVSQASEPSSAGLCLCGLLIAKALRPRKRATMRWPTNSLTAHPAMRSMRLVGSDAASSGAWRNCIR